MFLPTPSYAATLPPGDDRNPELRSRTAAAVILGAYLTFFTAGIIRAVQLRDRVIPPTDYSTPVSIAVLGRSIGEIGGAALLLYLICQWLRIARPMAGVPRRGASAVPSLLTTAAAFAGLAVATAVLAALHPAADPNALTGGAVRNGWTVPGVILDSVNAGVVGEIVIVAIPVLIGRRAGWHPAVIAAASMVLRWPFHIYHGTWSSLPWAAVWGGAHVLAYLYLRRLAPLVVYHTVKDAVPSLAAAGHGTLAVAVLAGYLLLLLGYLVEAIRDRLRRSVAAAATVERDPAAAAFAARSQGREQLLTAVSATGCWAACTVLGTTVLHLSTAVAAGGAAVALAGLMAGAYRAARILRAGENLRAYRSAGPGGAVDAVAAWSTSYTGHVALRVTRTGGAPPQLELNAARDVAAATDRTVALFPSRAGYRLVAAQLHLGRRPLTRRIRLTPAQAAQLGQETSR